MDNLHEIDGERLPCTQNSNIFLVSACHIYRCLKTTHQTTQLTEIHNSNESKEKKKPNTYGENKNMGNFKDDKISSFNGKINMNIRYG